MFIGLVVGGKMISDQLRRNNPLKETETNREVWNGTADYDRKLFEEEKHSSGDVYLASCFVSGVPKGYEIDQVGFVPRIAVVKPVGPKTEESRYVNFVDIRFLENHSGLKGEAVLDEKNFDSVRVAVNKFTNDKSIKDYKLYFTKVKLKDRLAKAIVSESSVNFDAVDYDGTKISQLKFAHVFVTGKNSQIIIYFKLSSDSNKFDANLAMFKDFLKTFEAGCFAGG